MLDLCGLALSLSLLTSSVFRRLISCIGRSVDWSHLRRVGRYRIDQAPRIHVPFHIPYVIKTISIALLPARHRTNTISYISRCSDERSSGSTRRGRCVNTEARFRYQLIFSSIAHPAHEFEKPFVYLSPLSSVRCGVSLIDPPPCPFRGEPAYLSRWWNHQHRGGCSLV